MLNRLLFLIFENLNAEPIYKKPDIKSPKQETSDKKGQQCWPFSFQKFARLITRGHHQKYLTRLVS